MRTVLLLLAVIWPGSVLAHAGHIIEVAGHNHWIAIGAIGAAGLVGLWGKFKKPDEEAQEEDEAPDDGEEEPA